MPETVRIAVIDSGVHPAHPHIDARRLAPGIAVLADGTLAQGAEHTLDRLGHGTAVAAAIQEKAPQATLLPVRVFAGHLKTSARALGAAIRWSIEQRVQIINLSLGSLNPAHAQAFSVLADEALQQGTVIVAAGDAEGRQCWPGCLPQVISVALDWDVPRETCRVRRKDGRAVVAACGYPRPIPGVPQQRNHHGISFAVAQVSGLAATAAQECRGPLGPALLVDLLEGPMR